MRRVSSRNIYFLLLCLCLLIFGGCTKSTGKDTETDTTEVPATTEALETVALKDAEIGDIVQMGIYEQDGNPETDDPICWDVLDKDGDAMLLISHDVIDYQRFSDSYNCVIWEDSQIRTWLNEEFYTDAFDKETQACIKESVLENPSIAGYVTGADESIWESRGGYDGSDIPAELEGNRAVLWAQITKSRSTFMQTKQGCFTALRRDKTTACARKNTICGKCSRCNRRNFVDAAVNRKVTESYLHYSGGRVLFTMYGRLLSGGSSGYVDRCR